MRDERPHLQLRDGRARGARWGAAARRQRRRWRAHVGCYRAGDPAERVLPSSDVPHLSREHREHGRRHCVPHGDRRRDLRPRPRARNSRSPRRRQGVQRGDLLERAGSGDDEKVRFSAVLPEQGTGRAGRVDDRRESRVHRTVQVDQEDARRRHAPGGGARGRGAGGAAGGPETSSGRPRQRAGSRTGTGAHGGHRPRRVESADEHRHFQREARVGCRPPTSSRRLRRAASWRFPWMPTACAW